METLNRLMRLEASAVALSRVHLKPPFLAMTLIYATEMVLSQGRVYTSRCSGGRLQRRSQKAYWL